AKSVALDTMTLLSLSMENVRARLIAGRSRDSDFAMLERFAQLQANLAPATKVLKFELVEGPARCTKCGEEVLDRPAPEPKPQLQPDSEPVTAAALLAPTPRPVLLPPEPARRPSVGSIDRGYVGAASWTRQFDHPGW